MTFQQFLHILQARYKVALYTLLCTVTVTLLVNLSLPSQYTASASVLVDIKSPDPIAGMILPAMMMPGYMETQADIINSDRVAQRVVKLLHMDESPEIRQQWQDATKGKGQLVDWMANLLQKTLDVKPSRESNVINIANTGTDPGNTAAVANAFAQAYIDVNLELKIEPARQSAAWFEGQTKLLRDKLEAAQAAHSSYQQKYGIVATDERLDYETAKLNDLSSQLTAVQAQTSDSHSKSSSAGGSETLVEVMQNPLINGLKSEVARLEAKLQESNINLGKNHPQTLRNETELASLKTRLASEIRKISSSIGTSYQVGKQKEKELIEAMDAQKSRVLALNKQRDEISVLKRDVDSAQRAYDGVNQRLAQTRMESLSTQTNVVMLNPASVPTAPSRPLVLRNVLLAVFLGTMLGVGLALMLELGDRRVRSTDDLAETIGLPVLATITASTPPPGLRKMLRGFFSGRKKQTVAVAS